MQKLFCLFGLFLTLSIGSSVAQELSADEPKASEEPQKELGWIEKLDARIDSAFQPVSEFVDNTVFYSIPVSTDAEGNPIKMPWVLAWLGIAAIVLTIYFKFLNFRSWRLAMRTLRGKYSQPNDPGEITHFQALSAAVSGTVGLGNIAGVAVAISIGGPGATFWMVLMGFLGMASKFCECTLGVKYRRIENGKVYGGPMQYLTSGLGEM